MKIFNMEVSAVCVVILLNIGLCFSQYSKTWSDKYENNRCPKLYPKNFINYAPVGNLTAGNFTEKIELKGLRECVMSCCLTETCNIVFIYDERCYHVECVSDEQCLPLLRAGSRKWESHVSMILVKPVLPNENWSDILDKSSNRDSNNNYVSNEEEIYSPYTHRSDINEENADFLSHFLSNLPNIDEEQSTRRFNKYRENDGDLIMDASSFLNKVPCEVGVNDECPINAECIPLSLNINSRHGICKCLSGMEESTQGGCTPPQTYEKDPTVSKNVELEDGKMETMNPVQNLTVTVLSKEVQLPDDEVTLSAYTIPDESTSQSRYSYAWTMVDQPKGSSTGNMKQNGATVTLTQLTEGQYRFKVTVNATRAYGEAFANVTVRARARVNRPPVARVTPGAQTVKLPNTVAVLDGSSSQDDEAIISWHWELTSGPIGYQPPLEDKPTLLLNDLRLAGNYTFQLTVEDSDHVRNSTTANVTVLNPPDYPPEANAGQDQIIYLPRNSVTLNGNLSRDDHGIATWQWTKAAQDENKAVDMQNTNSPYLQLSNLSEGMYTFVLRVTDGSGQAGAAEVHVFVKPPTNTPPVAAAAAERFISLPQTWVLLNGTASTDDHHIVAYTWRCTAGPTNATILSNNASVANATALTKGTYTFALTVTDDSGNTAEDQVSVTVTQNKNRAPVADAGGDQILALPLPLLLLNGSRSSDDFRVVSWRWTRAPSGLAAGTVVLGSDTQPVLMLTNIEAGRYVFELTVTDDQGESSRDTVSVQVKPDPRARSLLELTLRAPAAAFTQSQLDAVVQKMQLLLRAGAAVNVTEVRGEIDSGNAQIVFFLWENNAIVAGETALELCRGATPAGARLRSVRCLSACSGRGECDAATRQCRCDTFWMQSALAALQADAQPDCDWSVVYAGLGGVAALCSLGALCSLLGRLLRRAPPPRPHYRLLPRADREPPHFAGKSTGAGAGASESETDSDVLFETRSKTTSFAAKVLNGEASSSSWRKGHNKARKVTA